MAGYLIFLLVILGTGEGGEWQTEVEEINAQINELQEMQSKLQLSEEKRTQDAMRWQFQSENYLDARRTWDELDLQKQQLKDIQDRIDQLKARKEEILQKQGK